MSVEAIQNVSINASDTKLPKMQQMNVNSRRESAAASHAVIDSEIRKLETAIPSLAAVGKEQRAENAKIRQNQEGRQEESTSEKKYNEVMTEKAIENANNRIRSTKTNAKFAYNEDIDRITITITDADNEVIKEIPPEATQKMLERIHTFSGMVMDQEA